MSSRSFVAPAMNVMRPLNAPSLPTLCSRQTPTSSYPRSRACRTMYLPSFPDAPTMQTLMDIVSHLKRLNSPGAPAIGWSDFYSAPLNLYRIYTSYTTEGALSCIIQFLRLNQKKTCRLLRVISISKTQGKRLKIRTKKYRRMSYGRRWDSRYFCCHKPSSIVPAFAWGGR